MTKVTINKQEYDFPVGITALQACEIAGVEVPRFCYHKRLEIAGNCRMCLVEIQPGPPKPQASCAMPIAENMIINTNTEMVKKAREGVMEFLLANHPLDCPICDQGGECDLQDQAFVYGKGCSEFTDEKRAVPEKNMGPLIKTNMTRCIHCTRCVRFMESVAGTSELGAFGRGGTTEISTFLNQNIKSELSGNIIDLCPVGALTARPYAFSYRSWELSKTDSIDVMDGLGSFIRVDAKGDEVVRILPRENDDLNEEWISDKSRFASDGLLVQRLDRCYTKQNGKLVKSNFDDSLAYIAKKISGVSASKIAFLTGDFVDLETVFALKDLANKIHSPYTECRQDGAKIITNQREDYIFNPKVRGLDEADVLLIVGSNPRIECPVLNARIRKNVCDRNLKVFVIGEEVDLTYKYTFLGSEKSLLDDVAKIFGEAKRPMMILGQDALCSHDGYAVHAKCLEIRDKFLKKESEWNGFAMLHKNSARVAGLDAGFVFSGGVNEILEKCESGDISVVFSFGSDEIDVSKLANAFVVYVGTHGDKVASVADVILPAAAYTEKDASFVNTEGLVQKTKQAVRRRFDMLNDVDIVHKIARLFECEVSSDYLVRCVKNFGFDNRISGNFQLSPVSFYQTDFISRNSATMAKCFSEFVAS